MPKKEMKKNCNDFVFVFSVNKKRDYMKQSQLRQSECLVWMSCFIYVFCVWAVEKTMDFDFLKRMAAIFKQKIKSPSFFFSEKPGH